MTHFFDDRESAHIQKHGGQVSPEDGFNPDDAKRVSELVKEIALGKTDGFFIAIKTSPESDTHTRAEGMAKVRNMDRVKVLRVVLNALNFSTDDLKAYMLLQALEHNHD